MSSPGTEVTWSPRHVPDSRIPPDQRILDAAIRVFGDAGYVGASTEALAAAAGVTKGALYWYFANKADLFAEVVALVVRRWALAGTAGSPIAVRGALDRLAADDPAGLLLLHRAAAELMANPSAPWGEPLTDWHARTRATLGGDAWALWLVETHPVYRAVTDR